MFSSAVLLQWEELDKSAENFQTSEEAVHERLIEKRLSTIERQPDVRQRSHARFLLAEPFSRV